MSRPVNRAYKNLTPCQRDTLRSAGVIITGATVVYLALVVVHLFALWIGG